MNNIFCSVFRFQFVTIDCCWFCWCSIFCSKVLSSSWGLCNILKTYVLRTNERNVFTVNASICQSWMPNVTERKCNHLKGFKGIQAVYKMLLVISAVACFPFPIYMNWLHHRSATTVKEIGSSHTMCGYIWTSQYLLHLENCTWSSNMLFLRPI